MDNSNNSFENSTNTPTGEGTPNTQPYSQGRYPQPPEWTRNIVISDKPWIPSGEEGNVSVKLNESEKAADEEENREEDYEEELKRELPIWLQIAILFVIALITVLLSVRIIKLKEPVSEVIPSMQTAASSTVAAYHTAPTASATTAGSAVSKNTEKADSVRESTSAPAKTEPTSVPAVSGKEKDTNKRKIVEYFNESSNRVKTEGVKVVKNFEKRTHNADKLSLPSAIKGVAQKLLESKIEDITEPVEYPSQEAITAKYPVPGAEWSSCLEADDVAEAVCTEKDDEYEITLILKDCVDPEPGKGTSRAMDCLDVPTVRDTAPEFITFFSAEYYDCVIRCRVEKETGRVVWSSYTAPVLIRIGLDAGFVAFDAEIGLTFEKDYTITY